MSVRMLAAEPVVAQQHSPPGGAVHLALLAGVLVAGLVILGVSRWRARRDAAAADELSKAHDHPAENTSSEEKH
jgi:hypothetical protein